MKEKKEIKVETLQLDVNDIVILYTLAQQATIKVTDAMAVTNVMNKCNEILKNQTDEKK